MKYRVLGFLCLLLFTIGCRKNSDGINPYRGKWELRSTVTIAGLTTFSRGNGEIIVFSGNSMKRISRGTLISDEKYTLSRETYPDLEPARTMDRLTTPISEFFIELSNDTLSTYPPFASSDAGGSTYVRMW